MKALSFALAFLLTLAVASNRGFAQPGSGGEALPAQALHRFGTARFCTQAEVVSLQLSRDGKLLAAADRDGRVYLWDTNTGAERIATPPETGKRVALSPDGNWLALGEDAPFELRNLRKKEAPRLPIGNGPRAFAFSPDSKAIAIAVMGETEVVIYDIAADQELRRLKGLEGNPNTVAFSPDGKLLAVGTLPADDDENPKIRIAIWDALKGGDRLRQIDHAAKSIRQLAFLGDNKTLVGHVNTRLLAWNGLSGQRLPKLDRAVGSSYALDSAGKLLANTDGPTVLDFGTGKTRHEFEAPSLLRHLAMSGDGKLLAACPARFDSASPRILLWDLKTGKDRVVADAHRHFVDAVAFGQDGKWIATASNVEGAALVWDAKTAKQVHRFNLESLAAKQSGGPRTRRTLADGLAFSADRPELFVAGQRWSLKSGEPIPLEGDDDFRFDQTNSYRAMLTPDGRRAVSFLIGQSLLFWDPARAKTIRRIEPADKERRSEWSAVAFFPDGKRAVTGKWFIPRPPEDETPATPTLHVWNLANGEQERRFRVSKAPIVSMMLSPDGETLAVIGFPTRLELWHLPTGRLMREMRLADLEDLPRSLAKPALAFAPHGQWIAFAHREGEIMLLETVTGKPIHTFKGHRGFISSLAFSPDSRRLLSGGRDTTALLWSTVPTKSPLPKSWNDADALWFELGGSPDQAYRVVWPLLANPRRAVEVFAKRLQPDGGATEKEIRTLVTNLSSAKFARRDQAIRRLKEIGPRSFPALEQALKKSPDLETARRIQLLLRTVETALTPETLRDLRALQVLELIATPEATALLKRIAAGDRDAAKTRLARTALDRMRGGSSR
ncbi:MAG: DUF1513 domain-containing protein [Planctomycetes bacterium]|nr:DUF1513 domain-containing protein [Planctomycetota bacterium]